MNELTRFESDKEPVYIKARKTFIKMFQPHVNKPINQLPMVIDVMSLFMAGLDGNGFYGLVSEDDIHHHQQYDDVSLEILTLGINAYMDKHKIPKNIKKVSGWDFAISLNETLKKLKLMSKLWASYEKKKKARFHKEILRLSKEKPVGAPKDGEDFLNWLNDGK